MGVSRDLKSEAPTCVYRYICGCDKRMHIPVLSVVVTFPSSKNFAAVKSCLRRWRTKKLESITTCALSAVSDVAQECMVCIRDMYLVSCCSVCMMGRGGFILHKIQDIYCQRLSKQGMVHSYTVRTEVGWLAECGARVNKQDSFLSTVHCSRRSCFISDIRLFKLTLRVKRLCHLLHMWYKY